MIQYKHIVRLLSVALLALACSSAAFAQPAYRPDVKLKPDTAAPRVANNILGQYSRLVLSCTDVIRSMAWWARLGFVPMPPMSERPDSSMTLSDGQIVITLVKTLQPSPVIMFRTKNMLQLNDKLLNYAVPVIADVKGPTYGEIRIKSPNAVFLAIRSEADEPLVLPTGHLNPICGKLTELSIGTLALKNETNFWEMLGFVQLRGDKVPYPFAVMTDTHVQVGMHENREIPTLAMTYFSIDMAERIDRLKKSGMEITEEIPSPDGHLGNIILTSPDGQLVYMFEGNQ